MKKPSKIGAEIDGKVIRFWDSRFRAFCKEYNVKIVFSHDPGGRKTTKNLSKNDTKNDAEKSMPESWKKHQKGMQK